MISKNRCGQTLVESLGALWLLLLMFFCLYYIFLISIDKIRSLDTVYHLARVQQVQPSQNLTLKSIPVVALCFGAERLYGTQINAIESSGPPISEVVFQFVHNFSPSLLSLHKSIMRVAQPNAEYLTKSYPGAPEDSNEAGLGLKLTEESLAVYALSHLNAEFVETKDYVEDTAAKIEEEMP